MHAIALGELRALDRIGTMQKHRPDMLQDILVRLREETRQILDLNHQTRKTLRQDTLGVRPLLTLIDTKST